jgi:hypothetical protein
MHQIYNKRVEIEKCDLIFYLDASLYIHFCVRFLFGTYYRDSIYDVLLGT